MNKQAILIIVLIVTSGFIGGNRKSMSEKEKNKEMAQANKYLTQSEFYKAGQTAERLQGYFPDDPQVRELVTNIEARQAERYRDLKGNLSGLVDMPSRERQDAVQTLNERAEAYFREGKYAEASETAQEVFQYEPGNGRASKLIDKITGAQGKETEREGGLLRDMYRDEMTDRMEVYRREARRAMEEGRYGRARFALEKMLLLEPHDPEANRLYSTALTQLEKKAA